MKTQQTESGKQQRARGITQRIKELTKSSQQERGRVNAKISGLTKIAPDERYKWIAQAAYFRAEKRGFAPGGELEDWLEAEAEILRQLGQ
ncbi:MAG TPA: DUF2934 domain-containing protein [Burkholderiales bacterium]|nr:DUF2934 domain-containing protein [Burkholderiales bacterium]